MNEDSNSIGRREMLIVTIVTMILIIWLRFLYDYFEKDENFDLFLAPGTSLFFKILEIVATILVFLIIIYRIGPKVARRIQLKDTGWLGAFSSILLLLISHYIIFFLFCAIRDYYGKSGDYPGFISLFFHNIIDLYAVIYYCIIFIPTSMIAGTFLFIIIKKKLQKLQNSQELVLT
jgi:hypothetical protein